MGMIIQKSTNLLSHTKIQPPQDWDQDKRCSNLRSMPGRPPESERASSDVSATSQGIIHEEEKSA
jgi:hypothetical protein